MNEKIIMNDELRNMNEDWVEVELSEVLEIERGGSPRPIKKFITDDADGINWIKIGDTKNVSKHIKHTQQKIKPSGLVKSRMVYPGDFILSNSMSFGKPFIMDTEGAIHDGWLVLRDNYNVLNKDFLYHVLSSPNIYNQFSKLATGSTVKNLNIGLVSKVKIYLIPLVEQKAIVAKIEALFSDLDNGIANLKKAQEQLKIYRQAVLKKAFEGELTKEWREEIVKTHGRASQRADLLPTAEELLEKIKEERQNHYEKQIEDWKKAVKEWEKNGKEGKKPTKPKKLKVDLDLSMTLQKLKDLPHNWTNINLDFAVYKLGDGLHGTPKYNENGEYYFINGNNLNNGKILIKTDTKKIDFIEYNKYKKDLNKDTVLVSINGTIGNVSFYDNEPVILGKSACYFNLFSSINKSYIKWRIDSFGFLHYALKNATGSTIKNVPLSAMRYFIFPLCSLPEQHQIVQEIETRLSVCDKVEQSISESLEKAKALRQSILKKAFEGKLLSEQEIEACKEEPDYEPASVLLEKIKAEKLAKEQEAKKTKKKK